MTSTIIIFFAVLAAFQNPPPSIAPPPPPLAPEAVLRALSRLPAFAPTSGRKDLKVTGKSQPAPGSEGRAHYVEFQWADDQGAPHPGLAVIAHKSLDGKVTWIVLDDPWGVIDVIEDKSWEVMQSELGRARVAANEAVALGDIRTIISAQHAFRAVSEGSFAEMRCLAQPKECLPTYAGEPFLQAAFASATEKNGYRRHFHPGARAGAGTTPLLKTFAYTAVPITAGETGQRSFCGDATGKLCAFPDGPPPPVEGGSCPAECLPLK